MPTTGSRGSRNPDKSRRYTFVLDSFLAPFASWIMIQRNIAHYTVSTYYINDCQWCLKWKAWTCPQLLCSTLVSQKDFPTKLCSVRFLWPTRQDFFFMMIFLDYFGVAFYEILEMFRTYMGCYSAIPTVLVDWQLGQIVFYINVRLLLWSSMMNRLLPRTLAALSGIIVYHLSIQCQFKPILRHDMPWSMGHFNPWIWNQSWVLSLFPIHKYIAC